ncbi:sigma factor-like helix-turn-helix DNA-binding protein, partial [Lentilactobacillus parabuchneri]
MTIEGDKLLVFPDIIINSSDIRQLFNANNQIFINCNNDGMPYSSDFSALGLKVGSKKFNDITKKIQLDVQKYLTWKADHANMELDSNQYNLMLKYFGISDVLKVSINKLRESELKELEQEILFQYNISLDKRIIYVKHEIERQLAARKNWTTINRMMTNFDKNTPTLQEIGSVVGLTRERVRQIEKKIFSIKSNAVSGYRLEQVFTIENLRRNIPLLMVSELNNKLLMLFSQAGSKLIIQNSPFILSDSHNDKFHDLKRIAEVLNDAKKINIDTLWNFFDSFRGSRDEAKYKELVVETIKEFYGFKYIVNNTLFKSLSKPNIIYELVHSEFGNNFAIN